MASNALQSTARTGHNNVASHAVAALRAGACSETLGYAVPKPAVNWETKNTAEARFVAYLLLLVMF